MEYRKGMKVRITNDFDYDDPMGVNHEMEDLKGELATIVSEGVNEYGKYYRIDLDRGEHFWTNTMLVPFVVNKGKPEKIITDKIDVKKLIIPNAYQAVSVGSTGSSFIREYQNHWSPF